MALAERKQMIPPGRAEIFQNGYASESVVMLENREVDAAALTLDEVMLVQARGTGLKVVLVFDISAGADVLLARPDITTLAQLRGKKIGVEKTALGVILKQKMLELGKLDESEITFVPMTEDHAAAWENGQLDALFTYEPSKTRLMQHGLQVILDSRSMPFLIMDVLAVRESELPRIGPALRDVITGHLRALQSWKDRPVDTGYPLAELLDVEIDAIRAIYSGLDLPDLSANRDYLGSGGKELRQGMNELNRILTQRGGMSREVNPDELFSAAYLPDTLT